MKDDCPTPLELCVVCGNWGDYCPGHGAIGDSNGYELLRRHEDDDHVWCWDPDSC